MQMKKDEIKGMAGTIIFHALLVIALLFLALRTPLPLPTEGGVEVNLGNSDDGMGNIQPRELQASSQPAPPPQPAPTNEDLVTEDTEEAPAIEPKPVVKPKPVQKPEPKPVVKTEPTPEPAPKVDPRALFPGKNATGDKTGQGGNQGITGKPGDQGKPTGDPNATGYEGTGGSGSGVSFDLSGRSSRVIPSPGTNFKERGTVVVTIYVNRQGNVTRVLAGTKGSTTTNPQLLALAEQAAKQAKFSPKDDAPEEQKGSITYIFELN